MAVNIIKKTIRHVPLDEHAQQLYEIFLSEKKTSRYNYQFAGNTQDREAY